MTIHVIDASSPSAVLEALFNLDEVMAVVVASSWGKSVDHDDEIQKRKLYAAMDIVQKQQVFPLCVFCTWPVLEGEVHEYCQEQFEASSQAWADLIEDSITEEHPEDDDPYDIDDASRVEIEHGLANEMYN